MSNKFKRKRKRKRHLSPNSQELASEMSKDNEVNRFGKLKKYLTQSIESINWVREVIVALMTTVMVVIFSTAILWGIFNASPGEYKGDKLKSYLTGLIAADLHSKNEEEYLHIERMLNSDGNVLAICGNYKTSKDETYSGCFVYLFQRKQKSFWNALVGTDAGFEVVSNIKSKGGINYDSAITCEECFFNDIDNDGQDEVLFFYRCNYADRIMRFPIVFQEYNGVWYAVSSDFTDILENDDIRSELPQYINLQPIDFVSYNIAGKRDISIFGQTRNGLIRTVENPIWGGNDWLFYITASDTGRVNTEKTILVMERISDMGFAREKNWNGGKAAVFDTEALIEDSYDDKWGIINENGLMFYGEDSIRKSDS